MPRRSRKKLKRTAKETPIVISEYYQEVFALLHKDLLATGYNFAAPAAIRQRFWRLLKPGNYSSGYARDLVKAYLVSVESELASCIAPHSIAYWLHLYRRFLPRAIGEDRRPVTISWVRAILESAFHKFAKLSPCGGVGISGQISDDAILGGALMHPDFAPYREALRKAPQLVLTDFNTQSIEQLYDTEKLAYEIWKATAALRALGKGAELVVTNDPPSFGDSRSDELDELIRIYDDRHLYFDASATGTVFSDEFVSREGVVFLPHYDVGSASREILPYLLKAFKSRLLLPLETNFLWFPFNLAAYAKAHKPFEKDFHAKHQIPLASVFAVIGAIGHHVFYLWRRDNSKIFHFWQRAYVGPSKKQDIIDTIETFIPESIAALQIDIEAENVDARAVFEHLALRERKRQAISLLHAEPLAVFLPYGGDRWFVDYAWITSTLRHLFYGINPSDQNFKGEALENYVRETGNILPTGRLKARNGKSKQIDASFGVGDTLVVVECRAKAKSFASELSEPAAVIHRRELVDNALRDSDTKAKWLAEHPIGLNYDISDFNRIVPVAVTPFIEFMPSLELFYWLKPGLPRVLTPRELQQALSDGSFVGAYNSVSIQL